MEHLTCPVCETENDPAAAHCEVCGERLSPLEPGEVLAPEENVAALLPDAASDETSDLDVLENSAFEEDDFPAAAMDAVSSAILDEDENEESEPALSTDEAPLALYSPLDGTAYPAGSAEYEDGFGPMGEALVATPPELSETPEHNHAYDEDVATPEPVADAESPQDSYIDSAGISGSPQFREMFKSEPKVREPLAPLPRPGVHTNPATLSVFVNRQEAHRHYIENDETLLGRRDPHSDAYPDVDLSDFDEKGLISRKHAYVYRQNKNYTLYVVSNSGTQLNNELLGLGDRRTLKADDVIVLAGILAIKFELASS